MNFKIKRKYNEDIVIFIIRLPKSMPCQVSYEVVLNFTTIKLSVSVNQSLSLFAMIFTSVCPFIILNLRKSAFKNSASFWNTLKIHESTNIKWEFLKVTNLFGKGSNS